MGKKYRVALTSEERNELEQIIKSRSAKAGPVKRSYMLLAADEHGSKKWTDEQIIANYGACVMTVERLRQRFVEEGFEIALHGKKREPQAEKLLDGRLEAHLLALRRSEPPQGHRQWSLRLLAEQLVILEYVEHISHESVRQLLKKRNKALAG